MYNLPKYTLPGYTNATTPLAQRQNETIKQMRRELITSLYNDRYTQILKEAVIDRCERIRDNITKIIDMVNRNDEFAALLEKIESEDELSFTPSFCNQIAAVLKELSAIPSNIVIKYGVCDPNDPPATTAKTAATAASATPTTRWCGWGKPSPTSHATPTAPGCVVVPAAGSVDADKQPYARDNTANTTGPTKPHGALLQPTGSYHVQGTRIE